MSAEFKLYIIKDYQRLKEKDTAQPTLEWNLSKAISKINYKIHTDAIKNHLIPHLVSKTQQSFTYVTKHYVSGEKTYCACLSLKGKVAEGRMGSG